MNDEKTVATNMACFGWKTHRALSDTQKKYNWLLQTNTTFKHKFENECGKCLKREREVERMRERRKKERKKDQVEERKKKKSLHTKEFEIHTQKQKQNKQKDDKRIIKHKE